MKTYTNLLIFIILLFLIFDFFQMYSFKKNLKENLEIISSQIADLDEDIHLLEDLIETKKRLTLYEYNTQNWLRYLLYIEYNFINFYKE